MKNQHKPILVAAAALLFSCLSLAASAEGPIAVQRPDSTPQLIQAPVEPKYDALQEIQTAQPMQALATPMSTTCDVSGYANYSGQALVDHILQSPGSCINDLYDGNATSFAAFQNAKMVSVANAAQQMASTYLAADGDSSINNLFYFLRTGYYIEYYYPNDVGPFAGEVQNAVVAALDAFVGNADFYANSDSHGSAIQDAIVLMDSAEEQARYLPVIREWLSRWDASYAASFNMRSSVNGIFTVLFRGHYQQDFVDAASSDYDLIYRLGAFARSDWMLAGDALFMQENAARELARFLQYSNAPVHSVVKSEVQAILDRYSVNGTGASVWLIAANGVDYYGDCADFGICGWSDGLEDQVLVNNHTCSASLKIRAQDMTNTQMVQSCDDLSAQEVYFHQRLGTNFNPVADDFNEDLEVVVFDDWDNYNTYASIFYGIDTNNGGMYLEGNPADPANQARFIAHEADWLRPEFHVWNLTHEYVHYLDGRYNLKGDFGDARTGSHKTVWWIEGLAEYISLKDDNDAAITLARTQSLNLSEVFANTYSSGQDRVYRWGYLAVRFMFERRNSDVQQILALLRAGDYDAYLNYLNNIGTSYDTEWRNWLLTVESTVDGGGDNGGGDNGGGDNGGGDNGGGTDPVVLENGVPASGLSVAADGDALEFTFEVPQGASNLAVSLSGGSGDADLYLRYGAAPTDSTYDCRPYQTGNSESCNIAAPQEGTWYVRVVAYNAYADVSLSMSFDTDGGGTDPGDNTLTNGVAVTGVAVTTEGDDVIYTLAVPAGATDLNVAISGGSGDADLYVKHGSAPTDSDYDCRPYVGGNSESCSVPAPQAGTWYVRLKAYNAFSDVTLTASFTENTGSGSVPDACASSSPLDYGEVTVDTPTCIAASDSIVYTYVYVPAGTQSLQVQTGNGSGNAELYVNDANWATASDYDQVSANAGNSESISVNNPSSGWYYISLVGNPDFSGTSLLVNLQ